MKISSYKRKVIKKFTDCKSFTISKEIFDLFFKEILANIYSNQKLEYSENFEYISVYFRKDKYNIIDVSNYNLEEINKKIENEKKDFEYLLKLCLELFNFEKEREEQFFCICKDIIFDCLDTLDEDSKELFNNNNYFTFEAHAQLALYLGLYDCENIENY